ncbi:MAG: exodeoxyribonuclease [Candidatus Saccharibacteria bacterium]|nr:exodeoxyribonuclease [Candidatus Saccharibacteria bacterium]
MNHGLSISHSALGRRAKCEIRYTSLMKLYSWNVNGIRAVLKKGTFQEFIKNEQPDILCLQEMKAREDQAELDLPDYYKYWNSADKAGYSGTAIFSKVKPFSVINGFADAIAEKYHLAGDSYGDPTKEGRVISAEFDEFWVVTVYTPNSKGDLSRLELRHKQWDPAFLEHLKELEKTKPVLFSGDLNVAHNEIDLANPAPNVGKHGFTNEEREGFDTFEAAGFVDTFRAKYPDTTEAYSWWTHWANARARNVGWRIDYWLASQSIADSVIEAKIHPDVPGSDHCPVSIELKLT